MLGVDGLWREFCKKIRADLQRVDLSPITSLAETFDVGMDSGTQVDKAYEGSPFEFEGQLDKVIVTLTD